ncbi:type 4a pilus biogenesis protein PilO [Spirillospora albida]|uniref:type 4a pilus biogenesis protein PilO n=1 Tax=Spirillospora albida TaxID=58123 RepID=UPI0004C03048|nr:type 4a pilus biogenesis protein PilO [Spirillospora albida]
MPTTTGPRERLWVLGGALVAAALLALGWLLFIGPQRAETDEVRAAATAAGDRADVLQRRLNQLRTQNAELPAYRTRLAGARAALPATPAMSQFLRHVEAAADATGMSVGGVTVGTATGAAAGDAQAMSVPVVVNATGTAAAQVRFLDRLQNEQPRAVLITSVNVVPKDDESDRADLSVSLQVFHVATSN